MALPDKIKAVIQPDKTSIDLVETTIPRPSASGTDSLIRVKATSPCLRERNWPVLDPHLFQSDGPRIVGTEGAGVIVTAGTDKFNVGDEVYYSANAWQPGSLAEYVVVAGENIALKPASLSWTDAAATPLSALTAWQGLFEHGTLDPKGVGANPDSAARAHNAKQRVLVTGAVGGVGSWAVKFAHAAGAGGIIAVVSGSKAADATAFGATEVIDYTTTSADKWVQEDPTREVDMVLDCAGPNLDRYWAAVKDGGCFLSIVEDPAPAKPEGNTKVLSSAKWILVKPNGAELSHIGQLIEANGWKPLVDSVFPFEQSAEAYDKVDNGRPKGKVAIVVEQQPR